MEGACGVVQKLAYKRPIKRLADAGLDIPGQPPAINPAAVPAAAADEAAAGAGSAGGGGCGRCGRASACRATRRCAAAVDPPAEAPAAPRSQILPGRAKGKKGLDIKHDRCA
jgi:hypothetical protein